MWLVLGLLQLVVLVDSESKMSRPECDSYIRQSEPQVETILECLIEHYSLNRLLGQIQEKIDEIEHKLKEAHMKHKPSTTLYDKIDEILDINMSNQDCQWQQQMVQALRRKLEWHNLMNDIDISHFYWPPSITRSKWKSPSYDKDLELKPFRKDPEDSATLNGIQCLVTNSLQNSDVEQKSKLLLEKFQREMEEEKKKKEV